MTPLMSCVITSLRTLKGLDKVLLDQAPNPSFTLHIIAMLNFFLKIQYRVTVMGAKASLVEKNTDRRQDGRTQMRNQYLLIPSAK